MEIAAAANELLKSHTPEFVVLILLIYTLMRLWESRILEAVRSTHAQDIELLIRKREAYDRLARTLRVLLSSSRTGDTAGEEREFLAAYDGAAVWAAEEVALAVAALMDLCVASKKIPGSVTNEQLKAAVATCITEMRRDSGFPQTDYEHRIVSF